jgi:hypothetical protein
MLIIVHTEKIRTNDDRSMSCVKEEEKFCDKKIQENKIKRAPKKKKL